MAQETSSVLFTYHTSRLLLIFRDGEPLKSNICLFGLHILQMIVIAAKLERFLDVADRWNGL